MRKDVEAVLRDPRLQCAFRYISDSENAIQADQIRIALIPAPPFGESERARCFSDELREIGLQPAIDDAGNVVAPYEDFGPNPVVIAAHLDTVFPAAVDLQLRRNRSILYLPGISDNGSGLVALLWCVRAAKSTGLRFRRPFVVAGTVGEEGAGNLRGVRYLFDHPPWIGPECDFIAVDVGGIHRITNGALGSRRFRVQMTGPGGHSWADFGRPNPVHAMATAIHAFKSCPAARKPGTSFNFGVVRAGMSVNAIPREAVMEIDIRSVDPDNLDQMEHGLRAIVTDAAAESGVGIDVESMGERPSGKTPADSPLVQAAVEATRPFGVHPQLDVGSTDANIPMSRGIPAIAVGAGGRSGNIHTLDEWFDTTRRYLGLQRLLTLIAASAELK